MTATAFPLFTLAIGSSVGSGTTGSVLFVDSSGNLAQDNANFFWDDANNRLGIGTTAPQTKLDVNGGIYVHGGLISYGAQSDTIGSGGGIFIDNGFSTIRSDTSHNFHLDVYNGGTQLAALTILQGGNVGIGTTAPATKLDVAGSFQVSSAVALSLGGYVRTYAEAVTAALSGATGSIAVNIPVGARILGVQLRVDTLITSGDGGATWKADYAGGSTQAICTGQAFTKNTKKYVMFNVNGATDIVAGSVATITITCEAGGTTFSAGVVRAIVYYEDFTAMGSAA